MAGIPAGLRVGSHVRPRHLHRHDGIAHVRLNRPEKLNALTLQMLDELVTTARALRKDRTLRAVVDLR